MTRAREISPDRGRGRQRSATPETAALRRAKLALVAAYERGEQGALTQSLRAHPAEADALNDFAMALTATSAYAAEEITADVSEIAGAARARGFSAVFGPAAADVAPAALAARSLKALRQAHGVTISAASRALGLGVDVLSALEAGRIRITSAPRMLAEKLGELLDATAAEVAASLGAQVAPALRRGALGAQPGRAPEDGQLDFADAVLLSQSMTPEEKARWLAGDTARQ